MKDDHPVVKITDEEYQKLLAKYGKRVADDARRGIASLAPLSDAISEYGRFRRGESS